jgi:hypothetical protein
MTIAKRNGVKRDARKETGGTLPWSRHVAHLTFQNLSQLNTLTCSPQNHPLGP